MDLGCLDMGCIEKKRSFSNQTVSHSECGSPTASASAASKAGKNKAMKEGMYSSLVSLNKNASQIRKPQHRKTSPLNWFPRQKVDSYLKRKLKLLQEVDGMSSTLDETLGDSNPHYSRVLREKIAVREAAQKAMEARKAAMVEASWCRILKAARIDSKQAEERLMKAEKTSEEAFKAATAIGVVLYDTPDASQKQYNIETSASKVGGSTTHTVRTSFETAFEVDKQVASAVRAALINLANCPSTNKDEFKELLRKISQNPDTDHVPSRFSSEYESDIASELEYGTQSNHDCQEDTSSEIEFAGEKQRKCMTNLERMMMERLGCLQEEELASLATIVATFGLSAALEEAGNQKLHKLESDLGLDEDSLPSLDKFLVKRLTRLEREVQEAKLAKRNGESEGLHQQSSDKYEDSMDEIPSLDKLLVKHVSNLEKELQEAKNRKKNNSDEGEFSRTTSSVTFPADSDDNSVPSGGGAERIPLCSGKENIDKNKNIDESKVSDNNSLDKVLVKPIHRLEKMKMQEPTMSVLRSQTKHGANVTANCDGLDKILVKHVSKLEREKMALQTDKETLPSVNRRTTTRKEPVSSEGSLDQVLVKHKSRLEREKISAAQQSDDQTRHSVSRREAREKELQQAWAGLSLGNSIPPRLSRLQRDKAAWLEAEEEERRKVSDM